jgi:hypothetical protein
MSDPLLGQSQPRHGDYVLVFRNPDHSASEPSAYKQKLYTEQLIRSKLEDLFHINEHTSSAVHRQLTTLSVLNIEDQVPYKEYAKRVLSSVFIILQQYLGLELVAFNSADNDQIFVVLRSNEENLKVQADLIDYKLQLKQDAVDAGGILFPCQEILPFAPFEKGSAENAKKTEMLYQKYDELGCSHPDGTTFFRYNDRVRLIHSMIHSAITVSSLTKQQILVSEFPLHNNAQLEKLKKEWATFNRVFASQPLELIRVYFGEELALYFAWLQFYIQWLIFPTVVGTIIAVMYYISDSVDDDGIVADSSLAIFTLAIALSTSFMDQLWIRREKTLSWQWGLHDYERTEQQRPSFKGKYSKDVISGKRKRIYSPVGLAKYAQLLGYGVIVLFVGLVVAALTAIFSVSNAEKHGSFITPIGVINAIQIKVLNFVSNKQVYRYVARKMTDWENQETDRKYNDSLVVKLFCFQFVNSYASLFYIAFIKGSTAQGCTNGGCMKELQLQLVSIYFTNLLLNVFELGLPMLSKYFKVKNEAKRARSFGNVMKEEEVEALKSDYDSTLYDYMEMIIAYGYMVLFGVAFPFTPLFACVLAIIEVRVDAIKFCYLLRRPFPSQDNSIRIWVDIIKSVSYVGAGISLGVLIFTAGAFKIDDTNEKWILFMVLEHAIIVLKSLIMAFIPDMPKKVADGIVWGERVVNEKLYGKLADIDLERNMRNLDFKAVEEERIFRFADLDHRRTA